MIADLNVTAPNPRCHTFVHPISLTTSFILHHFAVNSGIGFYLEVTSETLLRLMRFQIAIGHDQQFDRWLDTIFEDYLES